MPEGLASIYQRVDRNLVDLGGRRIIKKKRHPLKEKLKIAVRVSAIGTKEPFR